MAWNYFSRREVLLCAKIFSEVTMATRFWTPQFLVLLAFIFKHKWNPVSENHNTNFTCTDFSLSVIEEPVIRVIFFSARERAEFNKSCNLIGSWSGRNSLIRTATAGGIHRVDLFSRMQ